MNNTMKDLIEAIVISALLLGAYYFFFLKEIL